MRYTKLFTEIRKEDSAIAGGKGASLGEMTQAGIPVPPGFVLLSEAFEHFLETTDLKGKIDAIIGAVNTEEAHAIESASKNIQELISRAQMPPEIAQEIEGRFHTLDAQYVAVRSSATSEDGALAAWAGQLESYLNTTHTTLLQNVQHCWASLFTPRAIFYRFEKELSAQKISVAVVIQKMVESEKSGVAFSVHPVTQDRNQIIIEAGRGLGEAIVAGEITPDSYIVDKASRTIFDTHVYTQTRGLYRSTEGGNEWKDISEPDASASILTNKEVLRLAELVIAIEDHYGFPCDIEWAFEKGTFYIVQSRPITTLSQPNKVQEVVAKRHEYRKWMNRSMFLMVCELWDRGERLGLAEISQHTLAYDPVFTHLPGKGISVYYNFTDARQHPGRIEVYFETHQEELDARIKDFSKRCAHIRVLIDKTDPKDFSTLFEEIARIWPLIAAANSLGEDESGDQYGTPPHLVEKFQSLLKEGDGAIHWGVEALLTQAQHIVPDAYREWVEYLLFDEIRNQTLPSFAELEKRKRGYIYHKGELYVEEPFETFAERNNFAVAEEKTDTEVKEIRGQSAYGGKVEGVVKIVFERSDIAQVEKGNILVTAMTTPNLLSAMKKAAAFVTDEGGVMCHAAIVAREFKKPCVIGTKIATKILKDGDRVEVNADRGVITILS